MSDLDSTLPNSLHSRITAKREQSIWPIMFVKHIVGQKLIFLFAILIIITLLSIIWINLSSSSSEKNTIENLHQELAQYKKDYQHQLTINQTLQNALQQQNQQLDQDRINIQEEDYLEPSSLTFEQTLTTVNHNTSDNKDVTFPLSPAIQASLFRMIPNDIPVNYKRISSPYGKRIHPISGKWKRHLGMDLTCPTGTPIFATADGVIEMTRTSNQGYGNLLKIRHAFGFMTLYAHLNQFAVKPGQFIEKGDRVGFCGSTGNSTGPHLHYEVRFIGKTLDPKDFMAWKPDNIATLFKQQKYVPWNPLISQLTNTVNLQVLLAMSQQRQTDTSEKQAMNKHKNSQNDGLTSFGIKEDGWAVVEE